MSINYDGRERVGKTVLIPLMSKLYLRNPLTTFVDIRSKFHQKINYMSSRIQFRLDIVLLQSIRKTIILHYLQRNHIEDNAQVRNHCLQPKMLVSLLYLVAAAASTVAFSVGTYENIKNEGVACLEIAASIPGLQTLVGTSYMQADMQLLRRR